MGRAGPSLDAAVGSFVALDSTPARRRLLAVLEDPDDALLTAPVLIVPCVGAARDASEPATHLSAGAAIRSLVVALHAQGLAWSWDPGRVLDPSRVRAALTLDADRRPIGVVAVGPIPAAGLTAPPSDRLRERPPRKYQRKTAVATYNNGCTSRALPCISLIAV